MAIINRLRFVDVLRHRLGDDTAREFTDALQDEMTPLTTKEEIQALISGLADQFEARMWRVMAFAVGILIGVIAIATTLIVALN